MSNVSIIPLVFRDGGGLCLCVSNIFLTWLNRAFTPAGMLQGEALTHRKCCEIIVVKTVTARTPVNPSRHGQTQTHIHIHNKRHCWNREAQFIYCHLTGKPLMSKTQYQCDEERARRINTLPHPPLALATVPHQQYWVMAHRLRECREERNRRGWEGRGTGSCGSHFIKQPELAKQNHAIKCNN